MRCDNGKQLSKDCPLWLKNQLLLIYGLLYSTRIFANCDLLLIRARLLEQFVKFFGFASPFFEILKGYVELNFSLLFTYQLLQYNAGTNRFICYPSFL